MKKLVILFFFLISISVNAQLTKADVQTFFLSIPTEKWGKLQITNHIPVAEFVSNSYYDGVHYGDGTYKFSFGETAMTIIAEAVGQQGSILIPYSKIRAIQNYTDSSGNYIVITLDT